MTGDQLRAAIAELGLTRYAFAVRCRAAPSTVYKWTKPGAAVPGYVETIVELLRERQGKPDGRIADDGRVTLDAFRVKKH